MNFDEAWDLTMTWEGGATVHQVGGDPGGLTKYGISQRAYPEVDIRSLSKFRAQLFAKRDYWDKVSADELPAALRWDVFDAAFNHGPHTGVRLLQKSINLCRQASGSGDFIREDGQVGPVTIQAADAFSQDRLLRVFRAYRAKRYLASAEVGLAKFIHGWLRRAEGERNG
jgi:lysozyme family protein